VISATGNASRPEPLPAQGGPGSPGTAAPRTDDIGGESSPPSPSLFKELSSALDAARAAVSNFLDLIALEARGAGLALMWMVVWGLVAALCVIAAWLGLMTALGLWAVSLGFSPIATVIVIAVVNLAAAAGLIMMCIRMSRALLFPAVRRQVSGQSSVQQPPP
jgi:hypothetical protein